MGTLIIVDFKLKSVIGRIEDNTPKPIEEKQFHAILEELDKELLIDALTFSYSLTEAAFFLNLSTDEMKERLYVQGINPFAYLRRG